MSYDENGKGRIGVSGQAQDKLNTELISIIQFTEKVATALCRKMDRAETLSAVEKEFTESGKYTGSVLLLTENRDEIELAASSVRFSDKKGFLEKIAGHRLSGYKISLDKSKIYGKVVREAQTLHVKVSDIIDELYPGPIAKVISATLSYEKEFTILTPIWVRGSVGGVLAMTAPVLAELAVPSVKNLAAYISFALESASQRVEHEKMEEELKKAQKLESLGILAGGIAHNFNNILTVVVGNISLAKMNMQAGEEAYETLSTAEKACLRARGLTQQLLTFSKGDFTMAEPIDIAALIKDSMISALNGSGVKYDLSIPDDLYSVSADKTQISQAINNLVLNAEQAMPEGGIIRISAENVELGPGNGLPVNSGRYVKTTIKDQGEGIPKENLAKIFDPFFSTRPKGSGLGLSVAFAIIKKHGGHISAESAQGGGAAFHVYLPAM